VRRAVTHLLVWSLSPVGTLLNAAMLYAVMVAVAGVRWDRPLLWLIVVVFVASSAYFDVRAYVARRRRGLTAYEAGEAVMERIWGPAGAGEAEER
jgi:cell division protein FtsW (lipid II flippase)